MKDRRGGGGGRGNSPLPFPFHYSSLLLSQLSRPNSLGPTLSANLRGERFALQAKVIQKGHESTQCVDLLDN